MFQKRHYEFIAVVLKKAQPAHKSYYTTRFMVAREMAEALGADNKRFDRDKFYKACGLDE